MIELVTPCGGVLDAVHSTEQDAGSWLVLIARQHTRSRPSTCGLDSSAAAAMTGCR